MKYGDWTMGQTEALLNKLGGQEVALDILRGVMEVVIKVMDTLTRHVVVNRDRTPQQVLDATGRKQYTDSTVVAGMPHGEGEKKEIVFFKLNLSDRGGSISDDDLEKEFGLRGLIPSDPYSLAAVNEADPAFADEHPNATHWKDAGGKWCFAAFGRWAGERFVYVHRYAYGWSDCWWFAGLRK